MNEQDVLRGLYDETLAGNGPAVLDLTNRGLELGLSPETMLFDALIPALEEVGARFERGDLFVPEMLIAGKAMAGAMEVLRPLLTRTGASSIGTFVMGTVKGDVHDIGKNLVNIMLEGAGFTVIDLGVQVPPERFVEAVGDPGVLVVEVRSGLKLDQRGLELGNLGVASLYSRRDDPVLPPAAGDCGWIVVVCPDLSSRSSRAWPLGVWSMTARSDSVRSAKVLFFPSTFTRPCGPTLKL